MGCIYFSNEYQNYSLENSNNYYSLTCYIACVISFINLRASYFFHSKIVLASYIEKPQNIFRAFYYGIYSYFFDAQIIYFKLNNIKH